MKVNFEVVEMVFSKIFLKIHLNLINVTSENFSFDQLKKEAKIYLLKCVLYEVKKCLINDLYYKTQNQYSKIKPATFFELILLRVKKALEKEFCFLKSMNISNSDFNWAIRYLEKEDGELFNLITSIILFTEEDNKILYLTSFDRLKLITSLLESLIVKFSSVFIYITFLNSATNQLMYSQFFCSDIDFLKIKKNNFYWQSYLSSAFLKPKYIYYNLYNIKILTRYGISSRLIYLPDVNRKELYAFSTIQVIVLFCFEFIDFIYPKLFPLFVKLKKFFILVFV